MSACVRTYLDTLGGLTHRDRGGNFNGVGVTHVIGLIVHMVDRAVGTQGVIAYAHVFIARFVGEMESHGQVELVDELGNLFEDPGTQEDVAVFDR